MIIGITSLLLNTYGFNLRSKSPIASSGVDGALGLSEGTPIAVFNVPSLVIYNLSILGM